MRRYITPLMIVAGCLVFLLIGVLSNGGIKVENDEATGSAVSLSEDQSVGHVTVETATIKAVWHYKALASENNNQGGGNIYELYYKPTDPGTTSNLVSFNNLAGWGDGQSTAIWTGIGGIGATTLYSRDTQPAYSQSFNFGDLLGDNNLSGTLESNSATIDQNGNAVINFSYRVRNQSTGKDWYRVVKRWTVEPSGAIHVGVDWTILSSGYFSEPALRTAWSYGVGWNQFVKYGRDWMQPIQPKYLLGTSGISTDTGNCWDYMNRFVPDWISFTGSSSAPTLTMAVDNNGIGFSGTGSYDLGVRAWGSEANPVQEQCTFQSSRAATHSINWMAAWGGNPPVGNRYAHLNAGTSWSDAYRIDLTNTTPGGGPLISDVAFQQADNSSVRLSWNTDVDSDSVVEVSTNPDDAGSWWVAGQDPLRTRNHSVVATGLTSGTLYTFRVKSKDAGGNLAINSGYNQALASWPTFTLNLSQTAVIWNNYADYLNRKLMVTYEVSNQGPFDAGSVSILSVLSTGGVRMTSAMPLIVGDIVVGSTKQITLLYDVPSGVHQFKTTLHFSDPIWV